MARKGWSFRRQKAETGLRAVGHPYPNVNIKHNGKQVGYISAPCWSKNGWDICIALAKRNGKFSWRGFKEKFETEAEARQAVLDNAEDLEGMGLHYFEEEDE